MGDGQLWRGSNRYELLPLVAANVHILPIAILIAQKSVLFGLQFHVQIAIRLGSGVCVEKDIRKANIVRRCRAAGEDPRLGGPLDGQLVVVGRDEHGHAEGNGNQVDDLGHLESWWGISEGREKRAVSVK